MGGLDSFLRWLVRLVTPTRTGNLEDMIEDDTSWDQGARTFLAIFVVVISAVIIYWIMN